MGLPKFQYLAPQTVEAACSLLSQHRDKAKIIAGGTDLLINMKNREEIPQYLIALKNIPDLDYIEYDAVEGLRIGSLASHKVVSLSPLIQDEFNLLADAAGKVGTPQIRNMGTIGGNLCNAAPSADTASPLLALDATVKLVSPRGERTVPLEQFFTGPLETILELDELLTEIQVPRPPPHTNGVYLKLCARGAVDITTVGVAVVITVGEGNTFADARIALTTAAPTPTRAKRAEIALIGRSIEDGVIKEAAQTASEEAQLDINLSNELRQRMGRSDYVETVNRAKGEW
jgi:carbon-monoxide dehydrogenase medium subunit